MIFSSTTTKAGIIQEIERLTDLGQTYISGDATRLAEMTATINRINHRVWHTIFMATGNWQYDDGNYTDLPIATTDLVSGTAKYAIPSDALTIQRVEIKDENGLEYQLTPITKELIKGQAVDEFLDVDSTPMYYSIVNGTMELFPAPNYASTGGLKVYFDRACVDFAYNDTTKTPGFASPYHEAVPVGMAIEWLKMIAKGSITTDLPLVLPEQGSNIVWGSQPKRNVFY
jgi:hypothetical protein